MKNLKTLTNSEVVESTFSVVKEERRITLEVLYHFKEIEMRKIHLEQGYPTLFAYIVKELGYSDSAAYRRIEAMRALKETPEIEVKIESGAINLTTLAKVQTYFKAEKREGKTISRADKIELIESLENKSTREVERALLELRPEAVPEEKIRAISNERTELKIILSEELKTQLDQIKDLLSHKYPNMNYTDLIGVLAKNALAKLDPALRKKREVFKGRGIGGAKKDSKEIFIEAETKQGSKETFIDADVEIKRHSKKTFIVREKKVEQRKATSAPKVNFDLHRKIYSKQSRYIPATVKYHVWMRDRGQCTYKNHKTGQICGSKKFLEYDHVKPFSFGGESTAENLRLLCRGHNQART